ncbi:hypothetical protein KUV80_03970 [Fictibacillus nanhaiensis]|uniref:hypothetical protein n=1 Tax=Fictibacillus nanhaiensis TaxID=742169 RepID=UPI001C97BCB2|nr:hypothetical protein [Fictibacillus nanhaiensis]MBY6035791.1 hypothetical protein [Fictibacillus nanhaiensis]
MTQEYQNYVNEILQTWNDKQVEGARTMIKKYGYPDEATESRLIWYNNGPWKRTIVYRDPVRHNFPTPHLDFIEQVIDYRVPPNRYDEVAQYDGSVYLDRTKGEASAKCDKEAMNFLALNILNDIVAGRRNVRDAKLFYAQTAYHYMNGNTSSPYTKGLLFPKQLNTADPDIIYFN